MIYRLSRGNAARIFWMEAMEEYLVRLAPQSGEFFCIRRYEVCEKD